MDGGVPSFALKVRSYSYAKSITAETFCPLVTVTVLEPVALSIPSTLASTVRFHIPGSNGSKEISCREPSTFWMVALLSCFVP